MCRSSREIQLRSASLCVCDRGVSRDTSLDGATETGALSKRCSQPPPSSHRLFSFFPITSRFRASNFSIERKLISATKQFEENYYINVLETLFVGIISGFVKIIVAGWISSFQLEFSLPEEHDLSRFILAISCSAGHTSRNVVSRAEFADSPPPYKLRPLLSSTHRFSSDAQPTRS